MNKPIMRTPLGYKWVSGKNKKPTLVIDEKTAPLVRGAFEKMARKREAPAI